MGKQPRKNGKRKLEVNDRKLRKDWKDYREYIGGMLSVYAEEIAGLKERVGILLAATAGISDVIGPNKVAAALSERTRRIGLDNIGNVTVSTVQLTGGEFETIVEGPGWDDGGSRYKTRDEAVIGHAAAVAAVREQMREQASIYAAAVPVAPAAEN